MCHAGAAAKTEVLETSLTATKDQLLRLTADFENFRKRTVSTHQSHVAHHIAVQDQCCGHRSAVSQRSAMSAPSCAGGSCRMSAAASSDCAA